MTSNVFSNRLRRCAAHGAACVLILAGALNTGCDESADNRNNGTTDNRGNATDSAVPNTGAPGSTNPSGTSAPAPAAPGSNAPPSLGTATGRNSPAAADRTSPEARILSILHVKNQEEVEAGKLAQSNGGSTAVKDYGKMLETDHSSADRDVSQTATAAGVTLMNVDDVKAMLAREKGQSTPPADPLAELRSLKGAEFDSAFNRKMHEGHGQLIAMVEKAQGEVQNQQVKDLLAKMLPVLRNHETRAQSLMNSGTGSTGPGGSPTPTNPPTTPPTNPPTNPAPTNPPANPR